jgi:hypothetical protein
MGKTARADTFQGILFDDTLEGTKMKKSERPEEPKKMVLFPAPEFPKEKQARERIRQRREAEPLPSAAQTHINEPAAKREVPDPLPKRIILESGITEGIAPRGSARVERVSSAPQHRPPETAPASMSEPDRLVTALICASGLAAAGMSIYHGYHYLLAAGKPSWVAMITAVVMVVFSSTIFAFPFRRRFWGWALRGLGLATISFSIFSTIAVNYDQFSAREEAEALMVRTNEAKQAELELLRVQMEGLEAQIDGLKQEAAYWKDKSWARRDAAAAALQTAYGERSALWQRITATTEAAYPVTEEKTIFTYLAGLFHIRKNLLEFILFCIPAVFYDLLAALAVNAVFCATRRTHE